MPIRLATIAVFSAVLISTAALAQSSGGTTAGSTGGSNISGSGSTTTPGTNSAGTAQSSGITTGTGGGAMGSGTTTEPIGPDDAQVTSNNASVDRKVKSICKGC